MPAAKITAGIFVSISYRLPYGFQFTLRNGSLLFTNVLNSRGGTGIRSISR